MNDEHFLSRWSRLKRSGGAEPVREAPDTPATPAPSEAREPHAPTKVAAAAPMAPGPQTPLPPIESLEPGADISLFMQAKIGEGLKRQAFRRLLEDPRFNVMDGLDIYIDDYSKPDPLPDGWLEKMTQTARMGEYRAPETETHLAQAEPSAEGGSVTGAPMEDGLPHDAAPGEPPEVQPSPEAHDGGSDGKQVAPRHGEK